MSELFTKGSNHRNISVVLITQNLFHQGSSSGDIPLNSKYIVVFKNPRDKTQVVHLARQFYPENISSFHKTYLEACKDPQSYLFLDLTQSTIDYDLEQIFFEGKREAFAPVQGNLTVKVTNTFSTTLKTLNRNPDARQARARQLHFVC